MTPELVGCSGAGDCLGAPIAVGGTAQLSAPDAVVKSGPFVWLGHGEVRATAAGVGTLAVGIFQLPLASRPISAVRLGPLFSRAPRFGYVLDGETGFPEDLPGIYRPLALHVSDPHAVVRLWATEYDAYYGSERLVDTSLQIREAEPAVRMTAWDVLEVPPVAGVHRVVLEGDSFNTYTLDIAVVDHLDSLEAQIFQTPHAMGDTGRVCFHAYTDFVEVAIDMSVTVDGAGEGGGGAGRNCITAVATGPGTMTITAQAGELRANASFVVQ